MGRVYLWTILGTAACIAAALVVDSFNFPNLTDEARLRAILVDILLPAGLAAPLLFFFTSKLRDLAIAHHRLTEFASIDALTGLLNRAAFTAEVEAHLSSARDPRQQRGALLVIDADNFKAINDSYGHDQGDEALRLIAGAIRAVLRKADRVGRLGGEEFGVLLPGSTPITAEAVAERIRQNVRAISFSPSGTPHPISVSIGGAVYEQQVPYNELFRRADQQLYVAKQKGRNRVTVAPILDSRSSPAVAA
ncbi:MAG: GGDEF domain-containing protein [Devosia sp.]|nr:GGDEF domain-containing protein [Devosia sp.]